MKVLEWSSQTLDLNLIEMLWHEEAINFSQGWVGLDNVFP